MNHNVVTKQLWLIKLRNKTLERQLLTLLFYAIQSWACTFVFFSDHSNSVVSCMRETPVRHVKVLHCSSLVCYSAQMTRILCLYRPHQWPAVSDTLMTNFFSIKITQRNLFWDGVFEIKLTICIRNEFLAISHIWLHIVILSLLVFSLLYFVLSQIFKINSSHLHLRHRKYISIPIKHFIAVFPSFTSSSPDSLFSILFCLVHLHTVYYLFSPTLS